MENIIYENILTSNELKEADKKTIQTRNITSLDLMEEAASAVAKEFMKNFPHFKKQPISIICGMGNNGGDGLVIARLLYLNNYQVRVLVIKHLDKPSEDFHINLERLKNIGFSDIFEINSLSEFSKNYTDNSVVIDALLGYGLNRPVDGLIRDIIEFINNSNNLYVISIDIPSGLFCDFNNEITRKNSIRPDLVYTIGTIKLSLLFPENDINNFVVTPLVLCNKLPSEYKARYRIIRDFAKNFKEKVLIRKKFSYKNNYGHALLIAGSKGKIGAAVLAAKSCMKCGCGLLTVHVPSCGYEIIQTSIPEAMVNIDTNTDYISVIPDLSNYSAIGVGPGISTNEDTKNALYKLITTYEKPIIFDADAINIISTNKNFAELIPKNSVLTPHVGEFRRLVGNFRDEKEKIDKLSDFVGKHNVHVVLKGTYTIIASPDGYIDFNVRGTPAMATAGSGDVLTGIILSFIAQGIDPYDAARLGVFVHSAAAEMAERKIENPSILASDIINNIILKQILNCC